MKTVTGVFTSRADAGRTMEDLRSMGVANNHINLLAPGASKKEIEAVPTTETEQPGMGGAIGGVVGGALGAAGGMGLGAAAAMMFVPGVGPVMVIGALGAALLGAGGAIGGVLVGRSLEEDMDGGLPKDELFVYEDALRSGRTVIIVFADDSVEAGAARKVMERSGAESIDSAREGWWLGLRDAEEEEYVAQERNFKTDEPAYRSGFEAALHPDARGKSYTEAFEYLTACYPDLYREESFRRGFERGRTYYRDRAESHKP
ncbi:MAG: phosphoribosyltransferase [Blastocatellia bacterium]|nr:phosphoribosyltransferase [Blastocatellia bacterium]